ncbi:MAG: hypothetical protein LBK42_11870 [Propionibacteriaceae bacterium]|jgi:hypothetical protein|nr:hypothetical protein [Propionibacteriaceae bacterium]
MRLASLIRLGLALDPSPGLARLQAEQAERDRAIRADLARRLRAAMRDRERRKAAEG